MTDGEPETVVSASLQKIKSIKNPIIHFLILLNLKLVTHLSIISMVILHTWTLIAPGPRLESQIGAHND